MTRATAHLAKGEWRSAVALHPLAPAVAVQVLGGWLLWGCVAAGRLRAPSFWALNVWLGANVVLLVGLWLWRLWSGTVP